MDRKMTALRQRLLKFRDARDWSKFHDPKDLALSISIEASEILEVFQWRASGKALSQSEKLELEGEVADVFSYLILLCERTGIDLIEATNKKIDYNELRFPVSKSNGAANPEGDQ